MATEGRLQRDGCRGMAAEGWLQDASCSQSKAACREVGAMDSLASVCTIASWPRWAVQAWLQVGKHVAAHTADSNSFLPVSSTGRGRQDCQPRGSYKPLGHHARLLWLTVLHGPSCGVVRRAAQLCMLGKHRPGLTKALPAVPTFSWVATEASQSRLFSDWS